MKPLHRTYRVTIIQDVTIDNDGIIQRIARIHLIRARGSLVSISNGYAIVYEYHITLDYPDAIGYMLTMPPGNLGRDFVGHWYPTCKENGSHRYLSPHAISKDRTTWYRVCRLCHETIIMKFDVEAGQIIEKVIKDSTRSIDNDTIDKSIGIAFHLYGLALKWLIAMVMIGYVI